MRAFLGVLEKRSAGDHGLSNRIPPVAARALPFVAERSTRWCATSGLTQLWAWSNEPEPVAAALLAGTPAGAVGWTGYVVNGDPADLLDVLGDPAAVRSRVDGWGGAHAILAAGPDRLLVVTRSPNVDPVYWYETADRYLVGTRALLVHLAGAERMEPCFDPAALAGFLNVGFMTGTHTPFRGTRAVPPGRVVAFSPSGVRSSGAPRHPTEDSTVRAAAEGLAGALLGAVQPLRRQSGAVSLQLSGGKDSRLMAAVLHAAGIPFVARTGGFADHPDVVVGARVARALGVEHVVAEPGLSQDASGGTLSVDPWSIAGAAVFLAEGMLTAYERFGRPFPSFSADPLLGGHGGEILRGGYLKAPTGRRAAVRKLGGRLAQRSWLLRRAEVPRYAAELAPWFARCAARPATTLDEVYLAWRAGRWSAAQQSAMSVRSSVIQPFFDPLVVRAARRAVLADRCSERLLSETIRTLAPALGDIPFAGDRWRFEAERPADGDQPAWQRRAPVTAPPGNRRGGFDWRVCGDPGLVGVFREQIVDDPRAAVLFEVADRRAVGQLLDGTRRDPFALWCLFTASVLLSGQWLAGADSRAREIRIPVPAAG